MEHGLSLLLDNYSDSSANLLDQLNGQLVSYIDSLNCHIIVVVVVVQQW